MIEVCLLVSKQELNVSEVEKAAGNFWMNCIQDHSSEALRLPDFSTELTLNSAWIFEIYSTIERMSTLNQRRVAPV